MYKKGSTVYDPETKTLQKIEKVRQIRIHGTLRTFYRIDTTHGTNPQDVWREETDLMSDKVFYELMCD